MPPGRRLQADRQLPEGATATDLVLTVTQMLRKKGVVDKFVEFYGAGSRSCRLADRATIANMAPEYGATMGFFPVDDETLDYLRLTGRDEELHRSGRARTPRSRGCSAPTTRRSRYSDTLELDLGTVEPALAGPKRPQDRVALPDVKQDTSTRSAARPMSRQRKRRKLPSRRRRRGAIESRRLGGDRRHHQLHQHLQPVGDARRRAAGEEGGGARPDGQAVGEDQPGARARRW